MLNLSIFFIFIISVPPNLNISGLFIRLTIVDSRPISELPPSRINLIFFQIHQLHLFLILGLF